jgi:uncharacterized protein (DUF488 family)
MKLFTIGYGGRTPDDLIHKLTAVGVRTIADVRLRPDRASMGVYAKAKTPDKGIERLFASAGIAYRSLPELGNVFMDFDDWRERYAALLQCAGHLLIGRLEVLEPPVCLLCAERRVADCHRLQIAQLLALRGAVVEHLES